MSPGFLVAFYMFVCTVSGRSSAYGDTAVEGHPAGPGSVSSSTGAISTTTAQQEGDGSEGEGETEGDIHTSNRSEEQRRSSDKDESLRFRWQQTFACEDIISLHSMAMGRENIYFWGAVVLIKNITFSPTWSTQLQNWKLLSVSVSCQAAHGSSYATGAFASASFPAPQCRWSSSHPLHAGHPNADLWPGWWGWKR